ncbi:hypothetical protein ScalyP_jg8195, partial [Parmales sp. scaly parma]
KSKKGTKKKGSSTTTPCEPCTGRKFTNTTIFTAVDAWCDDATTAMAVYGNITTCLTLPAFWASRKRNLC